MNETYVPCPRCGKADSAKVGFSWWGGYLGPKLLTHVRCPHCQTAYNGKTGKSNDTGIAIYTVAGLALAALIFYLIVSSRH